MDVSTLAVALGYTKKQIEKVKREGFKIQVERDRSILETVGEEKILYLLPKVSSNLSSDDGYDEFVYANNKWEWVGKTDVDLSQYALKEDVGDLDNLPTTDKSSLVAAVSETFTNVSSGKALIASAITDKGVQTASDATFATMAQNIEDIPSGGGVKTQKVNFYDFKGNLAHSYTAAEAEALTELPEAPTIEGFTFQKWNWSLASVKTWLTKHGNDDCDLNVGGLYVTVSGRTRIYMHLREAELANLEMPFCIQQMAGTVIIDWGDGSTPETITAAGIYSHTWQVNQYPADVVIDIEYVPSGSTKLVLGGAYGLFNNETYYASCVEKVEYGNNNDFSTYSGTFKNCKHLKTINIPFGFSTIGVGAFQNCTNLALTVLPDGITSIGSNAFSGCTNLALTVLPDGITSIGDYAFYNCTNLALTVLPDGVTSIGNNAFQNCTNLALTVLPDGVTSIGSNAFDGCKNLALTVLPDGVTSVSNNAFYNCTNLALTVLPDGIMSIGGGAFQNCTNLALTALPDGITSISGGAFQGCTNLALTALPDGITSIGNYAFSGCTNLALTVLPDGITSIGNYAFYNCTNLALTVLPDGVTSIGNNAFQNCTNLALTVLPDGVTSISGSAFNGCTSLALTVLPDGITSIGNRAFSGCTSLYIIDLTAFTNPQSIPTLANTNAFQDIPAQAQFWAANQEMYDVFTAATNWSTYASKFVIKGAI